MEPPPNPADPPSVDTIVRWISYLLADLNLGLLVYHLEDVDDPHRLRLVFANQGASDYTGADLRPLVGSTILEAFPGLADSELPQVYADVAMQKRARNVGAFGYQGDDNVGRGYFSVKAFPMPQNCVGIVFENISVRKQVEEMIKKQRTKE